MVLKKIEVTIDVPEDAASFTVNVMDTRGVLVASKSEGLRLFNCEICGKLGAEYISLGGNHEYMHPDCASARNAAQQSAFVYKMALRDTEARAWVKENIGKEVEFTCPLVPSDHRDGHFISEHFLSIKSLRADGSVVLVCAKHDGKKMAVFQATDVQHFGLRKVN